MPAKNRSKRLRKHQDTFRRNWFAAFNNVASQVDDMKPAELRVITRILRAALRKGRLAVTIDDAGLQKAANVSRSSLYDSRAVLVAGKVITVDTAGDHPVYRLLNPDTGKLFPGESGVDAPVTIDDDWGRMTV